MECDFKQQFKSKKSFLLLHDGMNIHNSVIFMEFNRVGTIW